MNVISKWVRYSGHLSRSGIIMILSISFLITAAIKFLALQYFSIKHFFNSVFSTKHSLVMEIQVCSNEEPRFG